MTPLKRCCVSASAEEVAASSRFQQICINWHHEEKGRLYLLEAKEFEQYFAVAQKFNAKGILYCCDGTEDSFNLY